ncbi:MAG: ABC transporter permease [Spirochaetaceae bacterium]|jgi:osmoprotectant transport system permease protein|nr:ABC transporter permease [Spirochaetaceae bacterium]
MEPYIAYFSSNGGRYCEALIRHLAVSGIAVALACAFAWPLGIISAANKNAAKFITGIFATLRIVPSLAILFLCIPVMGTGIRPALTALALLAAPPILINTTLAFTSFPSAVIETACALGMSRRRIFWTVKAPLSLPLVLAGVKTAAVEVIASATLAAYIGGGGLGEIIFTGLGLMRMELLLIGGISVAALSLFIDWLLAGFEKIILFSLFGGHQ